MELWPGAWTALLLLVLLLLSTLWFCSPCAKYFFKMAFYNGWILFLAILAIPVCAVRGRNVENMKILRLLLLHIKYLYGIRVEVRGAQHFPPTQPYVVVSNHQSSLDLLGMMEVLPDRCVPIAKRELLWAGSAGLACWLAGVIFIDRKRTGDAISVMSEVAQTLLTQDVRVWVFPEGTRNHNGSMLPFKRGAFHLAVQAQVPIVPIVMSSYQDFYCKKERRFTSAGEQSNGHPGFQERPKEVAGLHYGWLEPSEPAMMLLRVPPGRCHVRVLPPVPTEGLRPDDVPALADRVRHSMLTIFREISTDGLGGGDCLKRPGGAGEARL
ncbi:1-acyl-sn-glycerol-3-phosphate acyltransferase alpha [Cricetulus griseus]|uniref:1-acyl-sn-glycerol-3-phosphate acyltransferase n=1 Tax=Cricetulus griseus TaxID=10029 RepID=G3HZC6_CRIGR|nr:1-acyl-sn-glycerol-3-phosphate acyltransferase alpha [Cricetulus griseus]ERE87352.1 1-acyl-sn-glycerol-3-phosphate acyltransferase alpha-like protein [Cricetulus griseus]